MWLKLYCTQIKEMQKRAGQSSFIFPFMSVCPVPHKYVFIILISKVLFIISCLVNARLNMFWIFWSKSPPNVGHKQEYRSNPHPLTIWIHSSFLINLNNMLPNGYYYAYVSYPMLLETFLFSFMNCPNSNICHIPDPQFLHLTLSKYFCKMKVYQQAAVVYIVDH